MATDYREIHFLLGDPCRASPVRIDEWVAETTAKSEIDSNNIGFREVARNGMDRASALLYDSQLFLARDRFLEIFAAAETIKQTSISALARLGYAHGTALLKRHGRAEASNKKVFEIIEEAADPVVVAVASYLATLNSSDWGREPSSLDAVWEAPPPDVPAPLHILLRAFRAYVLARICLRSNRRRDGLAVVDEVVDDCAFDALSAIPRGQVLRMKGILLDVSSQSRLARAMLEEALNAFRSIGYRLGEVQAAFSLAKMHASIDSAQTRRYLGTAEDILQDTDNPGTSRSGIGRQMFGEKAQLSSRLAQVEFARGHVEAALDCCSEDLKMTRLLAQHCEEGLPRPEAYCHHNLGKLLLTHGDYQEALAHFDTSCSLFESVGDQMNVFFNRARRCTALLALGLHDDLEAEIDLMKTILGSSDGREKEKAIIETFQACLSWKRDNDPDLAQAQLASARNTLHRFGRDYYYARALVLEAGILKDTRDEIGAYNRLVEARSCALAIEAEDLRQEIEKRSKELGFRRRIGPQIDNALTRKELAVLYADLRDFTKTSAAIEPVKMAEFIRDFAERVSRCVVGQGGHPTRFLGDCVMALFGFDESSPFSKEVLAIRAVCEMDERLRNLRRQWEHTPELARIGMGCGIATGTVVVGRFGCEELSELSAIGDDVNRASRLQGFARKGEIYICPATFEAVRGDFPGLAAKRVSVDLRGLGEETAYMLTVSEVLEVLAPRAAVTTS